MIQKEITICNKKVHIAYCYATEINFNVLTDENVLDFISQAVIAIQNERPEELNQRKTLYLIFASLTAYYEYNALEAPITDKDLLFDASANDVAMALLTIITMYNEFYKVSSGEPKDKEPNKKRGKKKNA